MPALIASGSVGQASITAVRSASAGSAFAFSPSLVQALVQAAGGVVASLVITALAIDGPLLPKLDVEGSNPFARFSV
jgi:hypothetical protein